MKTNKLFALLLALMILPASALAVTVTTTNGEDFVYDITKKQYTLGDGVYEAELTDANEDDRVLNLVVNGAATLRLKENTKMASLIYVGDNANEDSLKLEFSGLNNEVLSIGYPDGVNSGEIGAGCKLEITGAGQKNTFVNVPSAQTGIRADDLKISKIRMDIKGAQGGKPSNGIWGEKIEIIDSELNLSALTKDDLNTGLKADGKLTITDSRVVVGMKANGERGCGVYAGKGVTLNDSDLIIQGDQMNCLLTNGAVVLNDNGLVYASGAERCGIAVDDDVTGTAVKAADTSAIYVDDCQIGIDTAGIVEITTSRSFIVEGRERAIVGTVKRGSGVKTYHKNFAEDAWVNFTGNSTLKQCVNMTPLAEVIYEEDGLPSVSVDMPAIVLDVESYGEDGVELYVEKIEESISGAECFITYEAGLYTYDGDKTALKEPAKMIFPYPAGYTKEDTHISYTIIHNKGKANEERFSTADGSIKRENCGLVIEVNALSPFRLSWSENVKPNLPKTGDESNLLLWAAMLLVSGTAGAALLRKKAKE